MTSNGVSPVTNIRALAVIAGQDLTPGDRPNGNGLPATGVLTDYFENILIPPNPLPPISPLEVHFFFIAIYSYN